MKKNFLSIFVLLFCALFTIAPYSVKSIAKADDNEILITSRSALLYDAKSGEVVYEKDSDKRLPIASMTKLASLAIIFEEMEKGAFSEETLVRVSQYAADTEGSSAFLDEGSEYKVGDLIMSIIIASANDSTVAMAEKVAGSEDLFVKKMNKKAEELGLQNTNFINSTGLPAIDHYSSARDVAKIYAEICDNKIYKKYSKVWLTELVHPSGRKTDLVNTNKLIRSFEGCDSGKTGFTNDAGYCLTASATRGGMRLIGVVVGAEDSKTRFDEVSRLFNYGFNNYENKQIFTMYDKMQEVKVVWGKISEVEVYPENDFVKFLKKGEEFEYKLEIRVDDIKAPKRAGDRVGKLYVLDNNNIVIHEDYLIVNQDVLEIKVCDILKKIYKSFN